MNDFKWTVNLYYYVDNSLARIQDRIEYVPLGLLYIASVLESFPSLVVRIFPLYEGINFQSIPKPDFDCISITSSAIHYDFSAITDSLPSPKNLRILGGFQATLFPEKVLTDFNANIVVLGEGEITIKLLFERILHTDEWFTIPNIFYFLNNKIWNNPIVQYQHKKKYLPARHLLAPEFQLSKDRIPGYPDIWTVSMITTRGCPYNCFFCGSDQKTVSFNNYDNIRREIDQIKLLFPNVGGIVFSDETATFHKKNFLNLCQIMKESNLKWSITTRFDRITSELCKTMKESGCIEIKFGAESGSNKILKMVNKHLSVEKMIEGCKVASESGLLVKLLLIYGLPGENDETMNKTLQFIEKVSNYVYRATIFNFCPLPGSYMYDHPKEFSILEEKLDDWNDMKIHDSIKWWWGSKEDFSILKERETEFKNKIHELLSNKPLINF